MESRSNEILKAMLTSYATRALTLAVAYLTAHGLSNPAFSTENIEYLGAAGAVLLIDLAILAYRKLKTHNLVQAAKEASPTTPMSVIKTEAASKPLLGEK